MAGKSYLHALNALCLGALALIAACRSVAAGETPAVLVAPSEAVHAELVAALGTALGAPPVVAADALTQTNVLIIDRAAPRPPNAALTGRTLGVTAQRFELVLDAGACVLVRPADGWRARLSSAECRPQKP
jgi:hypothetical protein